jgi:hypothetical protein
MSMFSKAVHAFAKEVTTVIESSHLAQASGMARRLRATLAALEASAAEELEAVVEAIEPADLDAQRQAAEASTHEMIVEVVREELAAAEAARPGAPSAEDKAGDLAALFEKIDAHLVERGLIDPTTLKPIATAEAPPKEPKSGRKTNADPAASEAAQA